jgi:hypothetical protein
MTDASEIYPTILDLIENNPNHYINFFKLLATLKLPITKTKNDLQIIFSKLLDTTKDITCSCKIIEATAFLEDLISDQLLASIEKFRVVDNDMVKQVLSSYNLKGFYVVRCIKK